MFVLHSFPCDVLLGRMGLQEGLQFTEKLILNAVLSFINTGAIDVIFTLQGDPSLFVASAVNRLLVHILTFSLQSETTSPLSMKDCSWPMCAQMIMAHIEKSLKSSSVSRIKQALKLLTSVFGCCHDQWTEILWSRIAEPIESLLKEEPVQTGHSLVDLFLSMAR